jgi:hypothetical protein
MRYVFAAVLALSCLPFGAAAKTWTDESCSITLSTDQSDPPFLLTAKDGAHIACRLHSWPLDTDIASMSCDDGTFPKMALMPSGQVLFGTHRLYPEGQYCGKAPAAPSDVAPTGLPPSPALPPITIDAGLDGLTEACITGRRPDGSIVSDEERRGACDESVVRVSQLMKSGYCPSADNMTWVACGDASHSGVAARTSGCNTYTSELWEPGARTATLDVRGGLAIVDHGERKEYPDSVTATGAPYRSARSRDGSEVRLRPYQDVLIIDMEVSYLIAMLIRSSCSNATKNSRPGPGQATSALRASTAAVPR